MEILTPVFLERLDLKSQFRIIILKVFKHLLGFGEFVGLGLEHFLDEDVVLFHLVDEGGLFLDDIFGYGVFANDHCAFGVVSLRGLLQGVPVTVTGLEHVIYLISNE